jgi:hypothetical protein
MSADPLHALASAGKAKSTRSVLRVVILALIAGAAIASRLFSVIRKCLLPGGIQDCIISVRLLPHAIPWDPIASFLHANHRILL